jgi:predicted DNA-binding transcriptional regulator YafY
MVSHQMASHRVASHRVASPAGRLLALLERVQERPGLTAPQLADELGVSERTARRYVATLQDLGIPVEANRGKYGGHRLRPGFRMPPLMLTTDESVALTLALAAMRGPGADTDGPAGRALSKLVRALPSGVGDRVRDVLTAVTPPADGWLASATPDPGLLAVIATGVVEERRCRLRHRSTDGLATVREVNPYGIAVVRGRCYIHGWCHLRQARRTFRMDRIERADLLTRTFRMPKSVDITGAVERSLALARPEWSVSLLFDGSLEEVQRWIPRDLGVCEYVGPHTTRVLSSTSNPDYFVLRISDHPFAMTVEEPAELRAAFRRAAVRMEAASSAP